MMTRNNGLFEGLKMPCVMEDVYNTLYNTKTERKNLLINEAFSFSIMLKNVENAVKSRVHTIICITGME